MDEMYKINEECVALGKNNKIFPNAVIGYDGFQLECNKLVTHKGGVIIGDNCTIGSCTAIDRGIDSGENTVLEKDVFVDNLVHIAHNVHIGSGTMIIAGSILGGHVKIGTNCFLGMNCTIKNRVRIGNGAIIGMGAVVLHDVPENQVWVGNPARPIKRSIMKRIVRKIRNIIK